MLSFSYLQQKLAFEIQNRYTKCVFESTSVADLITPTKEFIAEVAELALPDFKVLFRPNEMPPQEEHDKEESKAEPEFSLMTHVTNETHAYLNAINVVAISFEADQRNLYV